MPPKGGKTTDDGAIRVSLLAIPDAMFSTLSGLYDVFNAFKILGTFDDAVRTSSPFRVEIVAPDRSHAMTASGLPLTPHRSIDEIDRTDIVILPSMMVAGGKWICGRYP